MKLAQFFFYTEALFLLAAMNEFTSGPAHPAQPKKTWFCWVLDTRDRADVFVTLPLNSTVAVFAVWQHIVRCHRIPERPQSEGAFWADSLC